MIMRNAILALLVLSAAGTATIAGSGPAAAYDYPYCLQGRGVGVPGDCSYQSYAQCMGSADAPPIATSIRASPLANSGAGGLIGIITTTDFAGGRA
jgi:hypothetical protein